MTSASAEVIFAPTIVMKAACKQAADLSRNATHCSPCCGTRQKLLLPKQARSLPTAATRSPPFLRPRRRSGRSPMVGMAVSVAVAVEEAIKG